MKGTKGYIGGTLFPFRETKKVIFLMAVPLKRKSSPIDIVIVNIAIS